MGDFFVERGVLMSVTIQKRLPQRLRRLWLIPHLSKLA